MMSIKADLIPMHPGEVLAELYLAPLDMSAGKLAKAIHVPRTRIERLVNQETGITVNTALRLAKFFGSTPNLWLNMQNAWDLYNIEPELAADLKEIEKTNLEAA